MGSKKNVVDNTTLLQCTRCGNPKKLKDYYDSSSKSYEYIKKIPVCKQCISDIYDEYDDMYNDMKINMYKLCRLLDAPFVDSAFVGSEVHSKKTGWKIHQSYFKQVNSFKGSNNYAINFNDGERIHEDFGQTDEISDELFEASKEMKIFWGYGLSPDDYLFLEVELSDWKKTHKCDNQAEITLLREICIKILEIRKGREQKLNVGVLQKELQDLLKTASLDPAKANAASAGKSHESWGLFVKDIEQFRPAEWHDKQEKYKDMDGFVTYIQNYIVRPLRNFVTGNRDFQLNDNINADLNDDGGVDDAILS